MNSLLLMIYVHHIYLSLTVDKVTLSQIIFKLNRIVSIEIFITKAIRPLCKWIIFQFIPHNFGFIYKGYVYYSLTYSFHTSIKILLTISQKILKNLLI